MLQDFKAFIARGNVLDLAVAVIIGTAFGAIVSSMTEDLIMPVIGAIFGGLDFSNYFIRLGPIPADFTGDPTSYAALKEAGVAMLGYGQFITAAVNFLILAFIVFMLVRTVNRALPKKQEEETPAGPTEVELLAEIRDELKKRP